MKYIQVLVEDDLNGEDVGGQEADRHAYLEFLDAFQHIKEDRKYRVKQLAGKYVVATRGRSSGNTVFFQNQSVSNKGYWTQYLSNAQGFTSLNEAQKLSKGFKYNSPRVAIVLANGNYRWI